MILVFGATGYIGRYLCPYLVKKGYDVLALGRSKKGEAFLKDHGVNFMYFDMEDIGSYDSLPSENIEAIVDLSACLAEIEVPVEKFFSVNTLGAYHVLEYARQKNIQKVVITSSHKVYNNLYKDLISEDDEITFTGDHSPYIISKIAAEYFVKYYNHDFGMKACALRLTGVHGYGEILGKLEEDGSYKKSTFEIFFENALNGKPIEVWGDQGIKRDHVYIKDVISAIEKAVISKDAAGIYNVASGKGYSQYDEAKALAELLRSEGRSEIILRPELNGLERGYIYDISKIKKDMGWEPQYSDLRDMLSDYIDEWKKKEYHNFHYVKENEMPVTF